MNGASCVSPGTVLALTLSKRLNSHIELTMLSRSHAHPNVAPVLAYYTHVTVPSFTEAMTTLIGYDSKVSIHPSPMHAVKRIYILMYQ